MKRKKLVRGLALLLAALLVLGVAAVPLSALAADGEQAVTSGGDIGLEGLVGSGNMAKITVTGADGAPLAGVTVTLSDGRRTDTNGKGVVVFDRLTLNQPYTVAVGGYNKVEPNSFSPEEALTDVCVTAKMESSGGVEPPKPTPTPTPTPTPSAAPTPTPTPTPSAAPSPSPVPTATAQPTPPAETTPGVSPSPTPAESPARPPVESPAPSGPPPAEPSAHPGEATASPSAPAGTKPPVPPIEMETPEDRILVPEKTIGDSVSGGADVEIVFRDAEGNLTDKVVMAPFNPHDEALVEHSQVWVERREGERPVIQILKERAELVADAGIPHNIIEAARELQADVRVTFQNPDGGVYDFDALFTAEFFDAEFFDTQDTGMEYDPSADQGWLVFSNQAEVHGGSRLIAPSFAYERAAEDGWGIKVRVYNPQESTDLWYEWAFQPEDLKKVAKSLTDTDLFISPDRPELSLLDGLDTTKNNVQYLNITYHGQLPAPASLRVKNMAGFRQGDEVTLVYCNEQAGELQSLLTGLTPDEDGYITYGVEHCSVYVLTAPKPPVSVWYYVLGGAILLLLFVMILIFLLLGRKLMDELAWQVLARLDAWSKNDRSAEEDELAAWIAAELVAQEVKAGQRTVRKRLKKLLRKGYACKGENGIVITPVGEKRLNEHRGISAEEMVNHEQNK